MDFDFESYAVGDAQFTGRDLGDWYDPESLPKGIPRSFIKNFKRNFICAGPFDAGLPSDLLHVCTGLEGAVRDLAGVSGTGEGNSRTVDRILLKLRGWYGQCLARNQLALNRVQSR